MAVLNDCYTTILIAFTFSEMNPFREGIFTPKKWQRHYNSSLLYSLGSFRARGGDHFINQLAYFKQNVFLSVQVYNCSFLFLLTATIKSF